MNQVSKAVIAAAALATPIAGIAGPISKWDSRKPEYEYVSSANIFDAERCIIDADGKPVASVFRQPDRPDEVMIVFTNTGNNAETRIDLKRVNGQLKVKAWNAPKQLLECAPPA
jgi:hypothetical protein